MATEYNTILGDLNTNDFQTALDTNYTLVSTAQDMIIYFSLTATRYLYLPVIGDVVLGRQYQIINANGASQSLIIDAEGATLIYHSGGSGGTYTVSGSNFMLKTILKIGSSWIVY